MIRYTTIEWGGCCGKPKATYDVPVNITPYELTLLIPELSLEDAIELLATRVKPDPSCNIYQSQAISRQVRRECVFPAVGSFVTVNIPAGRYTSTLSQKDADDQAENEFKLIAQSTANRLGTCNTPTCAGCTDFRVTRTIQCGEFRRDTRCVNGQCVDTSQEYFVCTGNCDGQNCKQSCVTCSPSCPTGSCPVGYNCVNGSCRINCENSQCSLDCPQGSCQDPCTECRDGRCQPRQCPSGQICSNGQCIDRPCNPQCTERIIEPGPTDCIQRSIVQSCRSGQCVDTTEEKTVNIREGATCGPNSFCRNGQCTENPCVNLGGSCSNGICCSGLVCFNNTCIESCPAGYIRQNNTCVIDNGPNVLINQTVTSVVLNSTAVIGNTQTSQNGCGILRLKGSSVAVSSNTSLFWTFRDLVIFRSDVLGSGLLPPQITGTSCLDNTCYFLGNPNTRAGIIQAFNWYIQNVVAPTQYANNTGPTFGSLFNLAVRESTILGGICDSTPGSVFTVPYFVATAATSTSPILTGANVTNEGGQLTQTTNVTLSLSSNNPYQLSPYTPSPNVWQGFGFNSTWQNFTINRTNPSGLFNLQGRISGNVLEVRNSNNSPIFGTGNITGERLIGTFTVGTIVTKTLN